MREQPVPVARGLIVKTTTSTPSDSLLEATEDALDSDAEVADDEVLLKNVSTVDFDESVTADVAAAAAAEIQKRSDVVWAAPNTLRRTSALPPVTPSDTHFPNQRNLWDSTYASAAYSIKAPSLWRATKGSSDVRVAVVDTGILDHPDLGDSQLVAGHDFVGPDDPQATTSTYTMAGDGDGWDSNPSDPGDWTSAGECASGEPAYDSSWHGTFVAGQIAAKTDNGIGIAGVAPQTKVQPVRVLGHCGGWDSDIIAGLTWASGGTVAGVLDNPSPSQVVNLSLGYTYSNSTERAAACAPYAAAAAEGVARGTLFVAAAGNDGANANLAVPASCPGFLSVGATSSKGFSSLYSNIGSSVDLSAPGGDTLVEGRWDSILSLGNDGRHGADRPTYVRYEGTSMAAPQVSAAAALLLSLGVPADKLQSALLSTVAPFRARSSTYANKRITFGGNNYYVDLNCTGHSWCGKGILDLSKVQAPLTRPSITGSGVIGEPLTAVRGSWVGTPSSFTYQWLRGDVPISGAASATYFPTHDDVDATLSVRMSPGTPVYSTLGSTSAPTAAVPDGPEVTLSGVPSTTKYGYGATATVSVADTSGPVDGVVELRRGSTVLASKATSGGTAEIPIAGTQWTAGSNLIRAAFVANGTTPAASSVSKTVTVSKASSSVGTTLRTSVRRTSRATLGITVKVHGVSRPTGQLRIYDGSRRLVLVNLTSGFNGKRSIVLPRLSKGRHYIKVVYSGSSTIAGDTSRTRGITSY